MKFMVLGNIPKDFVEFMEKMEEPDSRVENLEEADVLLCTPDNLKMKKGLVRMIFENEKVKIDRNGVALAEVYLHKNYLTSLWAFVKTLVDGKTSVVSRVWAKKIVSGILQGMITLMEVEDKDGYSHSQRVAQLAMKFGKYLGFSDDDLERLKEHAMLHDVGKIGIEQLMLYSPTRIRIFENLSQDHTILGSIYLSTIELLWDVIPTVRYHHERWDGRGYPDGLKGEEIPYFARIVAVCNLYDNLTHFISSEWESNIKTPEEALEIIENEAGKALDPKLAKAFVEMMREGE